MKNKTYRAIGYVYGNLWGGGEAAYPSEPVNANTRKELIKRLEYMLDEGTLDSGMGYESLLGAIIEIVETETIRKNGKPYYRDESEILYIGKLTEKQETFLENVLYSL